MKTNEEMIEKATEYFAIQHGGKDFLMEDYEWVITLMSEFAQQQLAEQRKQIARELKGIVNIVGLKTYIKNLENNEN